VVLVTPHVRPEEVVGAGRIVCSITDLTIAYQRLQQNLHIQDMLEKINPINSHNNQKYLSFSWVDSNH
jgi:hypothetical protein